MVAIIVVVGLVTASCTGGDDDIDRSSSTTEAAPTTIDADSRAETAGGLPEIDLAEYEGRVGEVVDPDADQRCERLDYPCAWGDVDPDERARSFELAEHLHRVIHEPDDPIEGFVRALAELEADPEVVEIIADVEHGTGVMFRLAGHRPLLIPTPLSSPLVTGVLLEDEPEFVLQPDDLITLDELVEPGAPADGDGVDQPQGLRRQHGVALRPESYHPVGGPLRQRRALVLDPYAIDEVPCPAAAGYSADDVCFGEVTRTQRRTEGAAIAGIMGSHEQIEVTLIQGTAVDATTLVAGLSDVDLLHLATHGSAACAGQLPAYDVFPDRDLCYSLIALSTVDEADVVRIESALGELGLSSEGLILGRDERGLRVWITDELLRRSLGTETIAFLSSCGSASGQIFRDQALVGEIGFYSPDRSVIGWEGNARMSTSGRTAVTFWDLMVTAGLDVESAVDEIRRSGGDSTLTWRGRATLQSGGRNQRARDVITIADIDTRTVGLVGDGLPQILAKVEIEVEGVKAGTERSTMIELFVDGLPATGSQPVSVADGRPTTIWETSSVGRGRYSNWTVPLVDLELPFDLTLADVDPSSPRVFEFEARVSDDGFETYSAHRVFAGLSGELAASATLPTFSELASQLAAAGGSLEGEQLRLLTRSDGGPVVGRFEATMSVGGTVVGEWELDVAGEFDAASGAIVATLEGRARGGAAGEFSSEEGSGTLTGVLDLDTGELTGTIEIGGQTEPFAGQLADGSTDDVPGDRFDDLGPLRESDPGALVG